MDIELYPNKTLYIRPSEDKSFDQFITNFNQDNVKGLLTLLNSSELRTHSLSFSFWYEFCCEMMKASCFNENFETIAADEILAQYTRNCPFMKGYEYLDQELLKSYWQSISSKMADEFKNFSGDFRSFLEKNYPLWSQVGKIYFHLAENISQSGNPSFAFLATFSSRVSNKPRMQHVPLGRLISDSIDKNKSELLTSILKPLKLLAEQNEFVHSLIESQRLFQTAQLNHHEAYQLLSASEEIRSTGIIFKLPKSWNDRPPQKVKVSVGMSGEGEESFVGFNHLFKFHVSVTLAGEVLSEEEIRFILNQEQKLVQIKGQWVEVNKEKITQLLEKWQKISYLQKEGFSFSQAMRYLGHMKISSPQKRLAARDTSERSEFEFKASDEIKDLIRQLEQPQFISMSSNDDILKASLKANLRPYQSEGVRWLRLISQLNLGGCLADDMGLGKTIQIISLLLIEKELQKQKPSFLIAPASLMSNWQEELAKFAPSLSFAMLHRSFHTEQELKKIEENYRSYDLLITSYTSLRSFPWVYEKTWNLLLADEAQVLKNPSSVQTLSVKKMMSRVRFAITGTPIENHLMDLWSIFDFICPNLLGGHSEFFKFTKVMTETKNFASLKELIKPYLLRRKKTDSSVIDDLPQKTEMKCYCPLTKDQYLLYKATVDELGKQLKESQDDEIKRKGLILKFLIRFKQICNHPSQFYNDDIYDYSKSAKFLRLKDLLSTIASRNEKVLIFTQFKEITGILDQYLSEIFGRRGYVLHGSTPVAKRKLLVSEFQKEASAPYFILSLKAGGTGLNLTQANHVIHFDRWWNPAVENQATDRAFRIGQTKNVIVHKLITRGTIEERIDKMLDSKKSLSDSVIENTPNLNLTELSNEEIIKFVSLDINAYI